MNLRIRKEDFWEAAKKTRLEDQSLEMVYEVLVLGAKQGDIAKKNNISNARLSHMCRRIKEKYLEVCGAPKDWVPFTVVLPKTLANSVTRLSEKLIVKHQKGEELNDTIIIKKPSCTLTLEISCVRKR